MHTCWLHVWVIQGSDCVYWANKPVVVWLEISFPLCINHHQYGWYTGTLVQNMKKYSVYVLIKVINP